MKRKILLLILFTAIVSIINFGLWNVFFQQDEWYWFGRSLIIQKEGIQGLFQLAGFHFNPLYSGLFFLFYTFFHLDWLAYAIFSILLHSLNALLVFLLVRKIFKNTVISFLSVVFFTIANTSQQAITWYGASLNVLPAAACGLLSVFFFYDFYENRKKIALIISYAFLFVGLGFKEDIMSLLLIYALSFMFVKRIKNTKSLLLTIGLGLIYFLIRIVVLKFGPQNPLTHIDSISYIVTIGKNFVLIPLQSLSQIFFSPLMVYNLGHLITQGHESFYLQFIPIHNIDIFIETIFFNIVTVSLTIFFLVSIGVLSYFNNKKERVTIFILLLFVLISFAPFFLLPKGFGMESRHYYFPVIGGAVMFAYMIVNVWEKLKKKEYKYSFVIFLIIYFIYNFLLDRQQLDTVLVLSKPRIAFVNQIQSVYKNIPNNTLILSEGDVLPFQSGFGQMFMVLYDNQYQFNSLLQSNVLWDMGSQGYARVGREGFGYFSDKGLLRVAYDKQVIPLTHVYSFYWDNKKMMLTDTTVNTRKELSNNE